MNPCRVLWSTEQMKCYEMYRLVFAATVWIISPYVQFFAHWKVAGVDCTCRQTEAVKCAESEFTAVVKRAAGIQTADDAEG